MNNSPLAIGRVVLSLAGRDAGRRFLVVGLVDDEFVLIADGDLRRAEKPKKKRRKHLKATKDQVESLRDGRTLQDYEIRSALAATMPSEEG